MEQASDRGAPWKVYVQYLESGRLGFQECTECSETVFHPRVLCPACGSTALDWRESSGRGTVYAITHVHRREGEPYNVALVDLDEGFRMMSTVEGSSTDGVEIGERVRLKVLPASGGAEGPVPTFESAGENRT